jgi:hypothetical protein
MSAHYLKPLSRLEKCDSDVGQKQKGELYELRHHM